MIDDHPSYNEVFLIAVRLAIRSYAGSGQPNTVVPTTGRKGGPGYGSVAQPGSSGNVRWALVDSRYTQGLGVEEYCRSRAGF